MTCLGLVFFAFTRSEAILLDAVFNAVTLVMAALTLRVGTLIHAGETERYPFGYYGFESLLNASKGTVILLVCVLAAGSSVTDIIGGGRHLQLGLATIYAVAATVVCASIGVAMHRRAQAIDSPLVDLDALNWRVNALISGAVALAFGIAFSLEATRWSGLIPYVDPALVLILVVAVIKFPFDVVRQGVGQLLLASPDSRLLAECRARLEEPLATHGVEDVNVRISQVGRLLYILVQLVVRDEGSSVQELDLSRDRIATALDGVHPTVVVDVLFTGQRQWLR